VGPGAVREEADSAEEVAVGHSGRRDDDFARGEIEAAREHGIEDVNKVFETDELAPGEVIVAATGVTNGDLLRGVRFLADSARTHSIVMCTRHNWVRFMDGIHFFARDRREEVRLLG